MAFSFFICNFASFYILIKKKMKKFTQPLVKIIPLNPTDIISTSGKRGCDCSCSSMPDGGNTGGGCWGCPSCYHDNQGNHNCWEFD